MTYLIHCSDRRICGGISILRTKLEGACRFCLVAPKRKQKETQYDYALKEQMEYMDNQNFGWEGKERSMAQFNKRWGV